MEASLCNFIEPGDRVLVAVNGYFGERLCTMAQRYGAEVDRLEKPWGEVFDPAEIAGALRSKTYKSAGAGARRDLYRRFTARHRRDR